LSTKLPHYVLPAYPALALMTALFIDGWVTEPARYSRWWMRNATVTFVVVGVALAVALPIVASIYLPGEEILGAVGAVLIVGGAWALFHVERLETHRAIAVFTATSVVFVTAIFGFAAQRVDRHQNAQALLAAIEADSPGPAELASYRFRRESFVFYADRCVPRLDDRGELREYLESARYPYVFTSDEYEAELREEFPGEFTVVARRPKFLKDGEVVILARRIGRMARAPVEADSSRR
jgi:4-amino-4-deoxy-L-arabinose transferase-like glycosyltransferase